MNIIRILVFSVAFLPLGLQARASQARSVTPAAAIKAQPFLDWKELKQGAYAVGFKAIATTDATRSFQTPTDYLGRPRPANSLRGFGEGSFLEQARYADRVKASFSGLLHHDFSSMSSLQRRRAQIPTKDWSSATASYEAACRLILGFLESRLNGIAHKLDQGPETLCKVSFLPAQKAPPTATDLRDITLKEGFSKASELIRKLQKEYPEQRPSLEEPLVMLGYEALDAGQGKLALQVFALAVEIFPDSIDGSYGLGKTYFAEGSFEQAEPHYQSARNKVQKDPRIPEAQKAGILGRIDKILADIRAKRAVSL